MINPHVAIDADPNDDDVLSLEIFSGEQRVGVLLTSRLGLSFAYDAKWIETGDPLSEHLPFSGKYTSQDIHNYFDAFMPEGKRREALSRNDKIPGNDLLGFLRRHGEDLPGKLYALPIGKSNNNEDITGQIAKFTELDNSFADIAKQHSLLAGVDDKIAVIAANENGKWTFRLSNIENPSTHIIKKSNQLCVNEAFCMRLARLCGLSVMPSDILAFNGKEAFITERYDRKKDETGKLQRLEQKDFCQLAGKGPEEKYYRGFSGLSNEDIARILAPLPKENLWRFIEATLFSMIIGNNDDHGKNYSLLYTPKPQIAPLYDIASISGMLMFDENASGTNRLPRPVGNARYAANITPKDFKSFVKIFNLDIEEALRLFNGLIENVDSHVDEAWKAISARADELGLNRRDELDFLKLHIHERVKFFRQLAAKCSEEFGIKPEEDETSLSPADF